MALRTVLIDLIPFEHRLSLSIGHISRTFYLSLAYPRYDQVNSTHP